MPPPHPTSQTICWVLGEYGALAPRLPPGRALPPAALLSKLVTCALAQQPSDATKGYLVNALTKVAAQSGCGVPPEGAALLKSLARSRNVDLQQRSQQAQALLRCAAPRG